jgi:tRNA-splicing ligase RtcB
MSRIRSIKDAKGRRIDRELLRKGIVAKSRSWKGLAQEQPRAYQDVDVVVDVVCKAGLSTKVARQRPIGVIKG